METPFFLMEMVFFVMETGKKKNKNCLSPNANDPTILVDESDALLENKGL